MIVCYTLVDITCTNFVRRPKTQQEAFQRNQQRNYETFLQLISLRSQPLIVKPPTKIASVDINDYQFGEYYMPSVFKYDVWTFQFDSEHIDSYGSGGTPVGSLNDDFDSVPVIGDLTETAKIHSMINTKGPRTNTYFLSEINPT